MPRRKISVSIPKPVSIRDKVYKAVRNDVLNGRIPPGDRIVEARVAREINTSRTPVREALHMLEREGLLEAVPRVGYRVKRIDLDEMEELCEMRIINETLAARWAIDRISEKELESLEESLNKAEEEVLGGRPELFVEYDAQFHEILARASGSQRLYELCQLLCRHMLRYRIESLHNADTAMRAISGHRKILDCIKNSDKEGVGSAVKKHLEWVKVDIKDKIFDK
jgi:DNA-binding GntR family transcriptional regulator